MQSFEFIGICAMDIGSRTEIIKYSDCVLFFEYLKNNYK